MRGSTEIEHLTNLVMGTNPYAHTGTLVGKRICYVTDDGVIIDAGVCTEYNIVNGEGTVTTQQYFDDAPSVMDHLVVDHYEDVVLAMMRWYQGDE